MVRVYVDQSKSFYFMLQNVVVAGGRLGLSRVRPLRYTITLATSGAMINEWNWEAIVKRGVHIQQAIAVWRGNTTVPKANACPFPGCSGVIQGSHSSREW